MRRLISIAAFALLLAVPVWAQRGGHGGGGHGGGGGMRGGGFAGHGGGVRVGGGGHIGGGHSFGGGHIGGGMRSGPGFFRGPNHSFNRGFSHRPFRDRGFRNHRRRDFDRFGARNNCFGSGCWGWAGWYPWWGSSYPWWWDEDDRRFDEDYDRQYEIAKEMNQQSLELQRMLRQEEADGDQDAYASRSSDQRSAAEKSRESQADPILPATVLVFRDQHRQEVHNYAIVGQTLWAFTPQRNQKIPLADLDVSATEKANDDRGVAFRVPATNEAQ